MGAQVRGHAVDFVWKGEVSILRCWKALSPRWIEMGCVRVTGNTFEG